MFCVLIPHWYRFSVKLGKISCEIVKIKLDYIEISEGNSHLGQFLKKMWDWCVGQKEDVQSCGPRTLIHSFCARWAQVEWWLEHRHGWLVKRQWVGSVLGRVTRDEYQVLGSTSIPARLDTLVFWESFSWLTSVGTTRNTVIRLGWSRIGQAVLILPAAGAGLIGRPAVIIGRYNRCHSLQLQNHYAHFPPLQHTHIHAKHNYAELVMGNDHGFRGIVCCPWQEESCVIG